MSDVQNTTIQKALSKLIDLPEQGTLFTAQVHKVGVTRGPASDRVTYDDDVKQVLIWTGFLYRDLVEKADKILKHQISKGGYISNVMRTVQEEHGSTTLADVCQALQGVQDQFHLRLRPRFGGDPQQNPTWEPFMVGATTVRGCQVYNGRSPQKDSPYHGTIYIRGLKLGEKMITKAPNGTWVPDSKPTTIARNYIHESLPTGRYCQYRLDPSRVSNIAIAGDAVAKATELGIPIDPQALLLMFRVG